MDLDLHADLLHRLSLAIHKFENFQREARAFANQLATEVSTESIAEMKAVAKLARMMGEHPSEGANA